MTSYCKYKYKNGHTCEGERTNDGYCRWHSPLIEKGGPDDVKAIEEWAHSGRSMEGFHLKGADLHGINLVCPDEEGYDMTDAVLDRANLDHAHLFHLNLSGSSLLKTDLTGASLNFADLTNTNLLGVIFNDARIEHIKWGSEVLQEQEGFAAMKSGEKNRAKDQHEQAEEIYRNLRKSTESRGQFETAGHFFYKEMIMRRRQMQRWSSQWLFSKLVDYFCGYGEKPMRVVFFSIIVIMISAVFYFSLGVNHGDAILGLNFQNSFLRNLYEFGNCIYFSVVTFTTLGYGDMTPTPLARPVVTIEAFVGSFTLALFVVVFVKKMTR